LIRGKNRLFIGLSYQEKCKGGWASLLLKISLRILQD
jgi:hypothetical protein